MLAERVEFVEKNSEDYSKTVVDEAWTPDREMYWIRRESYKKCRTNMMEISGGRTTKRYGEE